ncbi:MAG: hypothetical protein KKE20_02590, partial [Nanoarchaeota archaeon]|nr:hypothetical protein [Nanoarchaeota archaeon]
AYMINPSPVFYNLITGSPQMLKGFISDLGGPIGIGAFYLMLVIIGLVYSWQENRKYYPLYMILVLYTISFYFARGYVLGYMNFFMVVFAAQGIKIIKDLNWQMKMIKNLTFIVIACGLLFSMISFSGRLAEMPPNENMEIGFDWLKQNSKPDDVVLSHYSNGYFIEYYASRPVLMDSYISHIQDFNQKYLDSYDLFNTYELKHAEEILKKYGIVYIVVTKDMKEGIVWESPDEGLLHLMKDPEAFKSVYISEELEIWKYLKKPQ